MERVKIFTQGTDDEFDKLEKKVNAWLARQKGKITITSRQMAVTNGINVLEKGFVNCTIAIFYRKK